VEVDEQGTLTLLVPPTPSLSASSPRCPQGLVSFLELAPASRARAARVKVQLTGPSRSVSLHAGDAGGRIPAIGSAHLRVGNTRDLFAAQLPEAL
jgi:hypothetical protein